MSTEQRVLDADGIAAIFAGCSFLLAGFVFWRDSLIRQFELATRLSEEIDRLWTSLNSTEDLGQYRVRLVAVLNHYERCALLLNDMKLLKSLAMKGLETQIVEVLKRNWDQPAVQEAFRNACTSDSTFCEIRKLLARSGFFRLRTGS